MSDGDAKDLVRVEHLGSYTYTTRQRLHAVYDAGRSLMDTIYIKDYDEQFRQLLEDGLDDIAEVLHP